MKPQVTITATPATGDPCPDPNCKGGYLHCYSNQQRGGGLRVRYYACALCGKKPEVNKAIVDDWQVPKRRRRTN